MYFVKSFQLKYRYGKQTYHVVFTFGVSLAREHNKSHSLYKFWTK